MDVVSVYRGKKSQNSDSCIHYLVNTSSVFQNFHHGDTFFSNFTEQPECSLWITWGPSSPRHSPRSLFFLCSSPHVFVVWKWRGLSSASVCLIAQLPKKNARRSEQKRSKRRVDITQRGPFDANYSKQIISAVGYAIRLNFLTNPFLMKQKKKWAYRVFFFFFFSKFQEISGHWQASIAFVF